MTDTYFQNKIAVVTGAGGTLCSEIAMDLAASGAKVVLIGRTEEKLAGVADKIKAGGGACKIAVCDVTDEAKIEELALRVEEEWGACDFLINGAGGNNSKVMTTETAYRPCELGAELPDVSGCDALFVGFPIWWYTCPAIIRTFLEGLDLRGKKVIPFATSGGSSIGNTAEDMKKFAPGADILPGRMLNGRIDTAELAEWVKSLGL